MLNVSKNPPAGTGIPPVYPIITHFPALVNVIRKKLPPRGFVVFKDKKRRASFPFFVNLPSDAFSPPLYFVRGGAKTTNLHFRHSKKERKPSLFFNLREFICYQSTIVTLEHFEKTDMIIAFNQILTAFRTLVTVNFFTITFKIQKDP